MRAPARRRSVVRLQREVIDGEVRCPVATRSISVERCRDCRFLGDLESVDGTTVQITCVPELRSLLPREGG
jgi:hypothetical protein